MGILKATTMNVVFVKYDTVGCLTIHDIPSVQVYLTNFCRYVGKMSRLKAELCLEVVKDGTYLVRKSESGTHYTHAIAVR